MFEKNLKYAYLIDFYGSLLDGHTEAVMRAYYDDDLSLAEVAGIFGISRQGVRHVIKRGEEQLDLFESHLMLASAKERTDAAIEELRKLSRELTERGCTGLADRVNSVLNALGS